MNKDGWGWRRLHGLQATRTWTIKVKFQDVLASVFCKTDKSATFELGGEKATHC